MAEKAGERQKYATGMINARHCSMRHASELVPSDPPWLLRRLRAGDTAASCITMVLGVLYAILTDVGAPFSGKV